MSTATILPLRPTTPRLFQRPLTENLKLTVEDLHAVPEALRAFPNWTLWKVSTRSGKPTKVPFRAHLHRTHYCAASNDPSTWAPFDDAVRFLGLSMNGHRGVGWVVTPETGLVFLDWDHVIVNDVLPIWLHRILRLIPSYAEASPSGTGLHQFVRGTLPDAGNKFGALEMYQNLRFATVTGNRLLSSPASVEAVDVAWLHRLLVARVFDFKGNPKLEKLLNGDTSDYPSGSEADLALCSLASGLGLGVEDIDRVFRLSGLYDEKWERTDYRESTIEKALQHPPQSARTSISVGSTGDWHNALLKNENGTAKPLLTNVLTVLRHDPAYKDLVHYDQFSADVLVRRPAEWLPGITVGSAWNDVCDSLLTAKLQKDGIHCQTRIAAEGLNTVAHDHKIHVVQDYLRSCVGDDKPRLDTWLPDYLGAERSPYTAAVGRCWPISAVARAMRPGIKADCVLGLIGPQGLLKSTALEVLASTDWYVDHISQLGDKDSRGDLLGIWICELGELHRVRGAAAEAVKNFLSTKIDRYRPAYGHRKQSFPRSCVFASTSNISDMLTDESGNRRWWPVECGRIDIEALRRDRDLLWAEALRRYEAGEHWWLDTPELVAVAEVEAEQHYETGPYDDLILNWLETPTERDYNSHIDSVYELDRPNGNRVLRFDSSPASSATHCRCAEATRVTIADILVHCLGRGSGDADFKTHRAIRTCLTHLGWKTSGKPEQVSPGSKRTARFYRKASL